MADFFGIMQIALFSGRLKMPYLTYIKLPFCLSRICKMDYQAFESYFLKLSGLLLQFLCHLKIRINLLLEISSPSCLKSKMLHEWHYLKRNYEALGEESKDSTA